MSGSSERSEPRFGQFKLVLLGESGVGKSSIVHRFVKDSFDDFRESTIGAAFLTQTIQLNDQTTIKFEIWDTAGQERYKSLLPMYYRNANCALVTYDITDESSLDRAKSWVKELQRQLSSDIIIALAGNKLDLEENRKISKETGLQYANELGLLFDEVSAKTGDNILELFKEIGTKLEPKIEEKKKINSQNRRGGIDLQKNNSSTTGGGCC